jgi:hypothetical protein
MLVFAVCGMAVRNLNKQSLLSVNRHRDRAHLHNAVGTMYEVDPARTLPRHHRRDFMFNHSAISAFSD